MGNPMFNGTTLMQSAKERISSQRPRVYVETLPGANGEYIQPHGVGGRPIIVEGVLAGAGGTPAAQVTALKTNLRAKQGLIDGQTIAGYVGEDLNTYANVVMLSYEATGRPFFGNGNAYFPVRATLQVLAE